MSECEVCASPLLPGAFFCGECGSSTRPRLDPTGIQRTDTRVTPIATNPSVFPRPVSPPAFSDEPRSAPVFEQPLPAPVPVPVPVPMPDTPPAHATEPVAQELSFTLQFANGDSISVASGGLLGRNPIAATAEVGERLIIVTDPDRTVSKTHLEFGIEDGSFWICDRFSGNGTTVQEPGRLARRLVPGRRYRIERGTLVGIGEQAFSVL